MQKYSIKELRHLLTNEKDFGVTQNYFFDWIEEHRNTAFNTITKNKALTQMLKEAMQFAYQKEVSFSGMMMQEVRGVHLIHGTMNANGFMVVFFYFSDLDWGMASCMMPDGKTGLTRFRIEAKNKPTFDISNLQN